jgi:uncharacterized protein DUF4833
MSDSLRCTRRSLLAAPLALLATAAVPAPARLFTITRSSNRNVLHYELRFDQHGQLDRREPLAAYWVMHEAGGQREELTWVERQLAYGWAVVSKVRTEGFDVKMLACPRRQLAVRALADGGYRAIVSIAGRKAFLERLFVQVQEGGLVPHVDYVELIGSDIETRAPRRERVSR